MIYEAESPEIERRRLKLLWNRVNPAAEPYDIGEDEPAVLLKEKYLSLKLYDKVIPRAPAAVRGTLKRLRAQEERHFKRLLAASFLMSSDTWLYPNITAGYIPFYKGLRELYHGERTSTELFSSAAGREKDPYLSRLYREIGEEDMMHAEAVAKSAEILLG